MTLSRGVSPSPDTPRPLLDEASSQLWSVIVEKSPAGLLGAVLDVVVVSSGPTRAPTGTVAFCPVAKSCLRPRLGFPGQSLYIKLAAVASPHGSIEGTRPRRYAAVNRQPRGLRKVLQ